MTRLTALTTAAGAALLFLSTYPASTTAQVLLSGSLPSCAQGCAQLQNAQSSCTPAGGAPVSNDQTYKSCFCQSSLLSTLHQSQPVQLCTQCSASDMQTIQSWYNSFCQSSAMPTGNAVQSSGAPGASNTATPASGGSTGGVAVAPAVTNTPALTEPSTTVGASALDSTNDGDGDNGPWIKSHWHWILMLVILVVGLSLFTVIFSLLHRRYHRRRELQWSQATVSNPDINTWGPGQSVHDFGAFAALGRKLSRKASRNKNKGKENAGASPSRGGAPGRRSGDRDGRGMGMSEVVPPVPALTGEKAARYGRGGGGSRSQSRGREETGMF